MATAGISSTDGNLPPLLDAYLVKVGLEATKPDLFYGRFAVPYMLPLNSGKTIEWFRYENMQQSTTVAGEGVTPPPLALERTTITTTVDQYIFWHGFTDHVDLTDHDQSALKNIQEKIMQVAAESIDTVDGNNATAGTSVVYANGVTSRATVAAIPTVSDWEKILKTLQGNNAKMVRKQIDAGMKEGTVPIRAGYPVIAHTDLRPHFESFPGFELAKDYASQDALPGEWGAWKNFRFFFTTNAIKKASAGAAIGSNGFETTDGVHNDVYLTTIFADGGFGTVPLGGAKGKGMKIIFNQVGSAGADDPGAQRGSLATKLFHGSKILNQDLVLRYESCAKINP